MIISQLLFGLFLLIFIFYFVKSTRKVLQMISLSVIQLERDFPLKRLKKTILLALGQGKMAQKSMAGVLHILLYIGFVCINIELIEIMTDGILGTHHFFSGFAFYPYMYIFLEYLAVLILLVCICFLVRRIWAIPRFRKDLEGWPQKDAKYILIFEISLMVAYLGMNICSTTLANQDIAPYTLNVKNSLSAILATHLQGFSPVIIIFFERFLWWAHILGVFAFVPYLLFSKHLHIILAFPVTYFSKLGNQSFSTPIYEVTREVKKMLNIEEDTTDNKVGGKELANFGIKEVKDLSKLQILQSLSCTECGRCSEVCPAQQSGKKLSPRRIMMSTRDAVEEQVLDKSNKVDLHKYITEEELWACNTCQACVEACPMELDPISTILGMRQYLVMELSKQPSSISNMFTNIENNAAPWKFSQQDRLNWLN